VSLVMYIHLKSGLEIFMLNTVPPLLICTENNPGSYPSIIPQGLAGSLNLASHGRL